MSDQVRLAAARGDNEALRLLQPPGSAVGRWDDALSWAAFAGQLRTVQWLVHQGADVNAVDMHGRTPAYWSARMGHLNVLQWLLGQGADALTPERSQPMFTPLEAAVWKGQLPVLRWLLYGASAAAVQGPMMRLLHSRPQLCRAAAGGHRELAEWLVEHGSQPDEVDDAGRTALCYAAELGHAQLAAWLTHSGAEPRNLTPASLTALLCAGARIGDARLIARALAAGADPRATNSCGHSAMVYALRRGRGECLALLCEAGGDLFEGERADRDRPPHAAPHVSSLHAAARRGGGGGGGAEEAMRTLCDPDALEAAWLCDTQGRTALHHAAHAGDVEWVERLLTMGAPPLHADLDGWLPLHEACARGHVPVAQLLLSPMWGGAAASKATTVAGETAAELTPWRAAGAVGGAVSAVGGPSSALRLLSAHVPRRLGLLALCALSLPLLPWLYAAAILRAAALSGVAASLWPVPRGGGGGGGGGGDGETRLAFPLDGAAALAAAICGGYYAAAQIMGGGDDDANGDDGDDDGDGSDPSRSLAVLAAAAVLLAHCALLQLSTRSAARPAAATAASSTASATSGTTTTDAKSASGPTATARASNGDGDDDDGRCSGRDGFECFLWAVQLAQRLGVGLLLQPQLFSPAAAAPLYGSLLLCGSGDVQVTTLLWLVCAGVLLIVLVTAAALACSHSHLRRQLPQVAAALHMARPVLDVVAPLLLSSLAAPALLGPLRLAQHNWRPCGGTASLLRTASGRQQLLFLLPALYAVPAAALAPSFARARALRHTLYASATLGAAVRAGQAAAVLLALLGDANGAPATALGAMGALEAGLALHAAIAAATPPGASDGDAAPTVVGGAPRGAVAMAPSGALAAWWHACLLVSLRPAMKSTAPPMLFMGWAAIGLGAGLWARAPAAPAAALGRCLDGCADRGGRRGGGGGAAVAPLASQDGGGGGKTASDAVGGDSGGVEAGGAVAVDMPDLPSASALAAQAVRNIGEVRPPPALEELGRSHELLEVAMSGGAGGGGGAAGLAARRARQQEAHATRVKQAHGLARAFPELVVALPTAQGSPAPRSAAGAGSEALFEKGAPACPRLVSSQQAAAPSAAGPPPGGGGGGAGQQWQRRGSACGVGAESSTPRGQVKHEIIDQALTAYFDDDMVEFSPRMPSQPGAADLNAPPSARMYAQPADSKNRGVVSLGPAAFKGRGVFRAGQTRGNRSNTMPETRALNA